MNPSTCVAGIDVHQAMLAVVAAHPGQEREWDWERRLVRQLRESPRD